MPDRKAERAEINRLLQGSTSIQMLAPRRVGKTWLMHRVAEDMRAQGWTTVFVDAEGMRSEDEFLRDMCRKIEEVTSVSKRIMSHLSQRLNQFGSGNWEGHPITAIGRIDPKDFSSALVGSLDVHGDTVIFWSMRSRCSSRSCLRRTKKRRSISFTTCGNCAKPTRGCGGC